MADCFKDRGFFKIWKYLCEVHGVMAVEILV